MGEIDQNVPGRELFRTLIVIAAVIFPLGNIWVISDTRKEKPTISVDSGCKTQEGGSPSLMAMHNGNTIDPLKNLEEEQRKMRGRMHAAKPKKNADAAQCIKKFLGSKTILKRY